ncbi:hypothetical protein NLG97_g4530 [Lecanicillium saksenae]|uniref:Uncharacterized protein n=1 Tax=Lecanicillium saksenae TaxID=468837 RepID=A0ACC1QWP8_9HYPO|nr:hypothetical protein NLG97_g4530 [Lecanicillium saksenae]
MWSLRFGYAATIALAAQCVTALTPGNLRGGLRTTKAFNALKSDTILDSPNIQECNFSVPVDHFHNDTQYEPHSNDFFPLRYFLDLSHYKPGGPVIVIQGGEAPATYRRQTLFNGIGPILAKATGGIVLVMEHRYYGTSFPVPDLSTENFRFLTTEQAVADAAYFAQHVEFPGLEGQNLTSATTPWFIWGGSYGGAYAAITRKLYPDAFWGAISSSGVTHAIDDYWAFAEATRLFAPGNCGSFLVKATKVIDTALFSDDSGKGATVKQLFGYDASDNDGSFASRIMHPISALQGESWVHGENDDTLDTYCTKITSKTLQYPNLESKRQIAEQLVQDAGYTVDVATTLLNYVGLRGSYGEKASSSQLSRQRNVALTQRDTQLDDGESWFYQTCTQWGFYLTGAGVPQDTPNIVSRAITIDGARADCRNTFGIDHPPNVNSINRLGGENFSCSRLAIIDGKQDPWRGATPHAIGANPGRNSTTDEPYILIDYATHHWDEDDVPANQYGPGYPPTQIVDVHNQEVAFVKAWIEEFHKSRI